MTQEEPQEIFSPQENDNSVKNPTYSRRSFYLLMKIISGTFGFLLALTPGIVPVLFIFIDENNNWDEILGGVLMAVPFLIIGISMIRSLVLTRKSFSTSWKWLSYHEDSIHVFGHMLPKNLEINSKDIDTIELGEKEQKSFESDYNLFKTTLKINCKNENQFDFGTIFESRHATINSNFFNSMKTNFQSDFIIEPIEPTVEYPKRGLRNTRLIFRILFGLLSAILGIIFYTQF